VSSRSDSASGHGAAVADLRHNLPREATSFVGREHALEDCLRLQRAARLLTLTGVGGAGKTRLALKLAERLLPRYPQGVWFVDLAPVTDPDRIAEAIAGSLGLAEEAGRPVRDTLARHFAPRRILLVLDNCEHLIEASGALAVTLLEAAAELSIVTTSREMLGVQGEQTYSVPMLSLPRREASGDPRDSEAVRLFSDRARLIESGFVLDDETTPAVVEICDRLDGIPLAIELAAARIRMLSVTEIRARLDDRFRLLAGSRSAALPRHQTLRAAIQWSYDHLGPEEQELLRALSVFVGGWTLEAAVAVSGAGRDEIDVLDLLTGLVNKSLVLAENAGEDAARYRFLETVRQYAEDLHVERGERGAARGAHAEWFLAWAEAAATHLTGAHQVEWLNRMERENGNLRAALDWCFEEEDRIDQAVRMAAAMQWLWVIRGFLREGRERLEAIAARAAGLAPTTTLASVVQGAGNACYRLDDFEAARAHYERALEIRERIGDTRGIAGSLGALGNVAQFQGRPTEALELFQRSLAINRENGNQVWEGANLTCLGNCSRAIGDLEAARGYLEQAIELNRRIGHRNGECFSLDGLGCVLLESGDFVAARALLEQALALGREIGNEHEQAVTLMNLGTLEKEQGHLADARARFLEAIRLLGKLGAGFEVAGCVHRLAAVVLPLDAARAVRLWSFARTFRAAFENRVDPDFDRATESIAAARETLGPAAFDEASKAGAALSLDEAIAEAVRDT
jgi:predicted ATPase/Tfp pilus assembly protein PilF